MVPNHLAPETVLQNVVIISYDVVKGFCRGGGLVVSMFV